MVAERVDHTPYAPAILLAHWIDFQCASCQSARDDLVWIGHGKNDSNGTSAQRLRAKITVLRRLIAQPKFSAMYT
jgi:hypothetical protein